MYIKTLKRNLEELKLSKENFFVLIYRKLIINLKNILNYIWSIIKKIKDSNGFYLQFYSILCRWLLGGEYCCSVLLVDLVNAVDTNIEVDAGTELMTDLEACKAYKRNNNYVIPSQQIESQLPGDFYHLTNDEITKVIEFKYLTKDYNDFPNKLNLLYKNLYSNHCELQLGSINNIDNLTNIVDEINNSDRAKLLINEINSDHNIEYLTHKYKVMFLKSNFQGHLEINKVISLWKELLNDDLTNHIDINTLTSMKAFRNQLLCTDTWNDLMIKKINNDKNNNRLSTIPGILDSIESRKTQIERNMDFNNNIKLIDLNKEKVDYHNNFKHNQIPSEKPTFMKTFNKLLKSLKK